MAGNHAILSPSGFKALMLCPAKPAMERGLPDSDNEYSAEGTLAHEVAAAHLTGAERPVHDAEMAGHVEHYVRLVHDYKGSSGELFVEQSLPIGHITGEEGAEGTGDAVILREDEIIVIDLKYGRGVEVYAEMNPQLMLYALGALEKFGMVSNFARVRMVIVQPRVSLAPDEFALTVETLRQWGEEHARPAAKRAMVLYDYDGTSDVAADEHCNPHEDACRFCKAKSTCPALARSVEQALGAEFTDLTTQDQVEQQQIVERLAPPGDNLGAKMDAVPLVEMWCKAIRARVEGHLLDGKPVPGYKLVAGRKGARAWSDAAEAEKLLKTFRLKKEQMYDLSLISPTTAEKVLKATPKRWAKVTPLIAQNEGKPSVAPVSDKRPALEIKPIESEFSAIGGAEDLV